MNQNQLTVSTYDRVSDPMAASTQLGEWIARSGMFGCERVEQGSILALQCIVERKAPLELAKHYHIIGGKLSLRADAMLALYRERGGKVKWLQFDDQAARARWIYDGNDIELSYTADDAKRAGLLPARGGGWAKHPAEMMRARLISKAVRMLAPEVCTGTYTPEEIEDARVPAPTIVANVFPVPHSLHPAPADSGPAETTVTHVAGVEQSTPSERVYDLCVEHDIVDAALEFLRHKLWLGENDIIQQLATNRCEKILRKPEAFVAAVKTHNTDAQ